MMDEKYFIIFLNLYREFFSNATFGTWKKSGIVTKVASLVTRHDDIATSDKCQGTESNSKVFFETELLRTTSVALKIRIDFVLPPHFFAHLDRQ